MLYRKLADSEHRWPSLKENADYLAIFHEMFEEENIDEAHRIFEGFDGGWATVISKLQNLYKPSVFENKQKLTDLERLLQEIYKRGFGRISTAWKSLQEEIDHDVFMPQSTESSSEWNEDDVDDAEDGVMNSVAIESDRLQHHAEFGHPDPDGPAPDAPSTFMDEPVDIKCRSCRMVEHPRPTRSHPKGVVNVLEPCDAHRHEWGWMHFQSSAERYFQDTHESNRVIAEMEKSIPRKIR